MRVVALIAILILILTTASTADSFQMLCDFDQMSRPWYGEFTVSSDVHTVPPDSLSTTNSLSITARRQADMLRACWTTELYDVQFSSSTQIKLRILGSSSVTLAQGQPHGGLILVETGGQANGSDSQWMINIPGDYFSGSSWREWTSPALSTAFSPGWASDADGQLNYSRVEKIIFVLQRDDSSRTMPEFTFRLDDFQASACQARQKTTITAVNDSIPTYVRSVQRGFVGRSRDAGQVITFSNVAGWSVKYFGQSEASFVRSQEEPLFGEMVGKLSYRSATGQRGYIRLEPPSPVTLQQFDEVLMWVCGNNWSWISDPTTPQVLVSLEITDLQGEKHMVALDSVNWRFWSMMHKYVKPNALSDERHTAFGGDGNSILSFPATLTAIEVRGGSNVDFRSLYFDSLIFRMARQGPPPLAADINNQPFPTTPDTILPSVAEPTTGSVTFNGKSYFFNASSSSGTLSYVYTPATGTLADLKARYGTREFKPCDGAGPLASGKAPTVQLTSATLNPDNSLRTSWLSGDGLGYTLILRLKGKSLVCDWESADTRVTELSLGTATGLTNIKLFNVPYLTLGWYAPTGIIWNDGLYCYTILDWYNTNASEFYGRCEKISSSSAACNGGSRYTALTNGQRNPLKERQFITVSPFFEEVLPNIPNPPSPLADITGSNLYCHQGPVELNRYQNCLNLWKQLKEYGIDHVMLSHHEESWTDAEGVGQGPQEYTMTLEAAPEIGDQQLIDYCREVRKLGWLIGLYTNYVDFSMLGKSWDDRFITQTPTGEWRRVWPPNFAIKPLKAVEMAAYYAPEIAAKFGTNNVYCDVHTADPPWYHVDYEAGTPGAGMLSTVFKSFGKLMMDQRKAYNGPVFSEGWSHWFYAGLNDGNYAQTMTPARPLLIDFDLRKIHPLQANISMTANPDAWPDGYYALTAQQIAYGHISFAPLGSIESAVRDYYLMQQLQQRYTQVTVDIILYRTSDGRMLPISEALPVEANKENQVYVKYSNGLEIYVNCNDTKYWSVTTGGKTYNLPPQGWVAAGSDFLEYSAEISGRRVNYCDSPVYTYTEAGGSQYDFGKVRSAGTVVIRKDDPRGLKIIPVSGASTIFIAGLQATSVMKYSGDDTLLGLAQFQQSGDGLSITVSGDARYYIIHSALETPVVVDSGVYTTDLTRLRASWTIVSTDVTEFSYAIGTDTLHADIIPWTSAGLQTSFERAALQLEPGKQYFIFVRARHGADSWSDAGVSDGILAAQPDLGGVHGMPDGSSVVIPSAIVTAGTNQLLNTFYIEAINRSSGIKVSGSGLTALPGDLTAVSGTLQTSLGERVIANDVVVTKYAAGVRVPQPLMMTGSAIGGAAQDDDIPENWCGIGLYNIGLLVRVCGRVTYSNITGKYFYIDDGSHRDSLTTWKGIRVMCNGLAAGNAITIPPEGSYLAVTGIAATTPMAGKYVPAIRPRSAADVTVF